MLLALLLSRKTSYFRLTTLNLWFEIAFWPTALSALTGWRLTLEGFTSLRHTNPLFGLAVVLHREKREE